MWPLYQPVKALKILKYCEISWDLPKKYFQLKSNAVYNSYAKNGTVNIFQINWVMPKIIVCNLQYELNHFVK